jgi:hypothetical protein
VAFAFPADAIEQLPLLQLAVAMEDAQRDAPHIPADAPDADSQAKSAAHLMSGVAFNLSHAIRHCDSLGDALEAGDLASAQWNYSHLDHHLDLASDHLVRGITSLSSVPTTPAEFKAETAALIALQQAGPAKPPAEKSAGHLEAVPARTPRLELVDELPPILLTPSPITVRLGARLHDIMRLCQRDPGLETVIMGFSHGTPDADTISIAHVIGPGPNAKLGERSATVDPDWDRWWVETMGRRGYQLAAHIHSEYREFPDRTWPSAADRRTWAHRRTLVGADEFAGVIVAHDRYCYEQPRPVAWVLDDQGFKPARIVA